MQIIWLDILRITAIFGVVVVHVVEPTVRTNFVNTHHWWICNAIDSSVRWCVPVFIMISGFLLLDNSKYQSPVQFYKKRLFRVIVPFVFWSIFYLIIRHLLVEKLTIQQAFTRFISGQAHHHFWFIYVILGLYLITPLIKIIIKTISQKQVGFVVLGLFAGSALYCFLKFFKLEQFPQVPTKIFIFYLCYFICGYFFRYAGTFRFSKIVLAVSAILMMFVISVGTYHLLTALKSRGLFFYDYISPPVIVFSVAVFLLFSFFLSGQQFMPGKAQFFKRLSEGAFGIYLVHPLILNIFERFLDSQNAAIFLIKIIVISFLTLAGSYCAVAIFRKIPYLRKVI